MADPSLTKKIFIQRDFSFGTAVMFSTEFPRELTGKVDESTYIATIEHINEVFHSAEALSCRTFSEGFLACLTGYAIHYCFKTHYERSVENVARYLQQQNHDIYEPRGIIIGDPMDRGLRCPLASQFDRCSYCWQNKCLSANNSSRESERLDNVSLSHP